jgi:prepilin-type N-terminal cleavage/methylation domain-containing protein
MKLTKNKKGFSLVELIVVIAIMAVLVGIIAPIFLNSVEKSRRVVDDANVSMLNRVTQVYAVNEEKELPDIFEGINTDDDRMGELVDKNYITKAAEPMVTDVEFIWRYRFKNGILMHILLMKTMIIY